MKEEMKRYLIFKSNIKIENILNLNNLIWVKDVIQEEQSKHKFKHSFRKNVHSDPLLMNLDDFFIQYENANKSILL